MNLFKNIQFFPTFWTQLLSAFNDNLFKNALIMLITFKLALANSQSLVVIAGGLFVLPFFLFSAFAGELSDKYPKNKLSQYLKLFEVFIVIIGSVGFLFHNIHILLGCLFLLGTQSALYGPIKYSVLPELLPEAQMVKANAYVEMGTFLSILIGTILGGLLINFNYGEGIVSSVCFILALVGYFISLKIPKLSPVKPDLKISFNFWKLNSQNISLVYPQKNIFLTVLGISWFWFLGACLLSLFPLLVKNVLFGDEHLVTLMLAIFSIGIAVGSIVCEKLSRNHLELGLVPLGSIGMVAFLFDLYLSLGKYQYSGSIQTLNQFLSQEYSLHILIDLFLFSIFGGFYTVPLYSYLQIRTKREERSRIIAFNNILNSLFMVIGAVGLLGLFALKLSLVHVILVLSVLSLLVSIYIYFFMPEFLFRFICFLVANCFYKMKVNVPKIDPDKSLVITSNHLSFVDWMLISSSISRPIRFVMDYRIYKNPILKVLFSLAKSIPIASKKDNEIIYNKAFLEIDKTLENGEIICIFPEGKITFDGKLNEFKKGIEKVLMNKDIQVLPVVIKGIYGSSFSRYIKNQYFKPIQALKFFRSEVSILSLDELNSKNVTSESLEAIYRKELGDYGKT